MHRISFYNHDLCYRGTTRAILSYAKSIQEVNSNARVSYLFNKASANNRTGMGLEFLKAGVELAGVDGYNDVISRSHKFDFLYYVSSQKPGSHQWLQKAGCKTLLHQNGFQEPDHECASSFAYTSYWQSLYFTGGSAKTLPCIIEKPDIRCTKQEAREWLGIPQRSLVIARHGGNDTWNLPFASQVVEAVARSRQDIVFLFLGTTPFCSLENVRFMPASHDKMTIERFLSASDVMLHARWEGETFGIACAEFLIRGKPIMTWAGSRERNHILIAEGCSFLYNGAQDLHLILQNLDKQMLAEKKAQVPIKMLEAHYSSSRIGGILHDIIKG